MAKGPPRSQTRSDQCPELQCSRPGSRIASSLSKCSQWLLTGASCSTKRLHGSSSTRLSTPMVLKSAVTPATATIDSYTGDGIVVSGYGRPFEAAAGLEVWRGAVLIDAEWRQVDRTGSGSSFAYSTTDWLEAWGRWPVGG